MTDFASSETDLVADVLAKHWQIRDQVTRTQLGVSRGTWRIGRHYWLSQAEHFRFVELSRQAALLAHLNHYLKSEDPSFCVPEIVTSLSGDLVLGEGGYVWCLTRDIPGFHPAAEDATIYPVLSEGLARFHRTLRAFSQTESFYVPDGICVKTRQGIDRLADQAFMAFTSDPREKDILQTAAAWLLPRLNGFERLPRQIVHGDWTPQNVLFQGADQEIRLSGVLDIEAMAWDAVCVDVANSCSTLLMWSGLDRLEERMEQVIETYERWAGVSIERTDIHTAMLAHWFCHYWNWRDRLRVGIFGREVVGRLCLRISSTLSYVTDRITDSH
ncbi:MAG TPA: phosphotransferase [Acidobacteriaceae bacterium]|nr:phosphotransferase [Acidobacteriaceae bacterium]